MGEKKYYSVPYISNSSLSWFQISPLYCHKRMQGEFQEEDKRYMTLGTQIHMAILEPEEFRKSYAVMDIQIPRTEMQKEFCSTYLELLRAGIDKERASLTAYKENYTFKNKTDKVIANDIQRLLTDLDEYISYLRAKEEYVEVLSTSNFNLIQSVISTVKNHKKAKKLFDFNNEEESRKLLDNDIETYNELPIYWEYPIVMDGEAVKCKSLIDRLIINHKEKKITLVDLKTTSKLGTFKDIFESYKYHRQLSFYWEAIETQFTEFAEYSRETFIVACSTVEPLECKVFSVSQEHLDNGTKEIAELMQDISWHVLSDSWDYPREYYEGDGTEIL